MKSMESMPGQLFFVHLEKTDGSPGGHVDGTLVPCDFVYTARSIDGVAIAEKCSPIWNRAMGPTHAACSGSGYFDGDRFVLCSTDEQPVMAMCCA